MKSDFDFTEVLMNFISKDGKVTYDNQHSYEDSLDHLWWDYGRGNPKKLMEYNQLVSKIKANGNKVLRNDIGLHKILIGN